jgi:Na+/melibiose symporter-like transporter
MSVMLERPPASEPRLYTCGTLKYTAFGLFMLFVWLLWGDFVWVLLDQSVPGILPFKLKDMGASDTVNQVLNRAIAYAVAFIFAPAVGFHSDRHRGRWGRRIPYLIWSTPFVAAFMVLIGYYDGIANLFMGGTEEVSLLGFDLGKTTVTLLVFGALLVGYDLANIFVNTIYWYLFNDVVPEKVMTRFMALFRIVGTAGGAIYQKWIFPHALDNFRFIFVTAGLCYMVGFLIMCFMVKEGQYPPPPENVDKRKGLWSAAKTFGKECFTHKFYRYFFLSSMFMFLSWQSGAFRGLRDRDSLGLTMEQLGNLGFWTNIVSLVVMYPAAWLADRYHPIRVYVIMTLVCFASPLAQCLWIFTDFGPYGNLVGQYVLAFAILPMSAVQGLVEIPMYMRLLPKDRYGQFCSANAAFRALAMILGSILAGLMMDALKHWAGMDEWRYRYYATWVVVCQIPSILFMLLLYREWTVRGGDRGYVPPA